MKNVYYAKMLIMEIKHIINECEKLKSERNILLGELNKINNTNHEELLNAIEYNYYSKRYGNGKSESKEDSRAMKIIKEFISVMYRRQEIKKEEN